jgi:osmotically-inducible protein OsmY
MRMRNCVSSECLATSLHGDSKTQHDSVPAVTLSGEVDSYPERRWAEEAVMRVHGVTAIAEEISVRSKWHATNDTDIAREAGEALDRAVDLPEGAITATVHDHVVTLSGHVPWNHQRDAASRAVRYLKGVANVQNAITIRPTVSASGVKSAITAALVRSAQFEGSDVSVTADSAGVVTLNGTVHSWSERQSAQQAAWFAPSVTSVTNDLLIQN